MGKSTIGDAIAATLAAAPEAAPDTERTIEVITSEILRLKAEAGERLIAIGQRLIEAKGMLPHGEWLPWLEQNVEMSEKTAQDFMRIAREFANPNALADLGKTKVLKLLLLPAAEREEFLSEHDVAGMSTRELEQAIRERDEARRVADEALACADRAQTSADESEKLLEDANARIRELESRPVEVAVQEPDEAEVEKRAREIAETSVAQATNSANQRIKLLESQLADAEAKAAKADAAAKAAKSKLKTASADAEKQGAAEIAAANKRADDARAESERLRAELDAAKEQAKRAAISGDAELAQFQLLFESVQIELNKMRGILLKVRSREDGQLGEKLTAALVALAEKVKECAS